MTLRERFHTIMRFEPPDRLPFICVQHLKWVHQHRWVDQGLPVDVNPFEHLGFDEAGNDRATNWLDVGRGVEWIEPDIYAVPRFGKREIEPKGNYHYTYDVRTGTVLERVHARTKGDLSAKRTVETPVTTREDLEAIRFRYDPHSPERYPRTIQDPGGLTVYPLDYPKTWEQAAEDTKSASHLVAICMVHGFNHACEAIGFERMLTELFDDFDFVRDMTDFFCQFACELPRRAFETARIDFVDIEGPPPPRTVQGEMMISPRMYLDLTEKYYEQFLTTASQNGVKYALAPLSRHRGFDDRMRSLIVEAGLTPILRADATGEFSLVERRREFGCEFPLIGGIEVRQMLQGPAAIDAMLATVAEVASQGGLFPLIVDRYGEVLEVPLKYFEYYAQAFKAKFHIGNSA
ncbi:MAG: hypothetical protein JXA11_17210 [Phycisphaerae bacterium]|nr:hypothetical protein [Phycisphaerae bacterium]